MKEIIYNYDNIDFNDVNRIVRRAKVILINDDDCVLMCHSNSNYFLVGGHVEEDEDDILCLQREILEEVGVDIKFDGVVPFLTIKYINKDYPSVVVNTLSIANYYIFRSNLVPCYDKICLTKEEVDGDFKLEYVKLDKVISVLMDAIATASRKNVIYDTIDAITTYMRINNY